MFINVNSYVFFAEGLRKGMMAHFVWVWSMLFVFAPDCHWHTFVRMEFKQPFVGPVNEVFDISWYGQGFLCSILAQTIDRRYSDATQWLLFPIRYTSLVWLTKHQWNNPEGLYENHHNQTITKDSTRLLKNIERHTAHTIVSWHNPKQWVIVHTSDLMMMIRQSIYIISIITRGVGNVMSYDSRQLFW